jgi:hypothetical protein
MPRPPADLTPREFRVALIDRGFCYLTPIDRYIDIRHPQPGRYLEPVKTARGAIDRRRTLEALSRARRETELARAKIRETNNRRQALASKIAPSVLPRCRADLANSAAIAQLADDYLTRLASAGCVNFSDLIQMGWTAGQLKEHGDAARAVADRKAVPA